MGDGGGGGAEAREREEECHLLLHYVCVVLIKFLVFAVCCEKEAPALCLSLPTNDNAKRSP